MPPRQLHLSDNQDAVREQLLALTPQERHAVIEQAKATLSRTDFIAYNAYVHEWELAPHQREWARMMMTQKQGCIVAPPESGKSRLMRSFIEWNIGLNPDIAVLLIQNTARQANLQVAAIANVLTSQKYKLVFPDIKSTDRWSGEKIFVVRDTMRPDATLAGYGIDGPYQGAHVDILVIDDPTDQKDVYSEVVMQSQKDLMKGVLFDRLMENGQMWVIFTRWGDNDLMSTVEEDLKIPIHTYPAFRDDPYPWGSQYLWEFQYSEERLREQERAKGPDLFKLTFLCSSSGAIRGKRIFATLSKTVHFKKLDCKEMRFVKSAMGCDWGCLPLDTEILTKNGWKTHEQLVVGEPVAAYDWANTRTIVWSPLLKKVYKEDQPLVTMRNKSFSFECTPDHAWIVKRSQRGRMIKDTYARQNLDTISRFKTSLVGAAPCYEEGEIDCSNGEAAVLGWVITDGHLQDGAAYIYQKKYTASVERDLKDSGLKWTEHKARPNETRVWRIAAESWSKFCERIGFTAKEDLSRIVTRLSPEAQNQMARAMLEAEGTKNSTKRILLFQQKRGPVMDAFQILMTLRGYRLGVERKHESQFGESNRLPILRNRNLIVPSITAVDGLHRVWCPSVKEGAVLARQRGQIIITGNTTVAHQSALVTASKREDGVVIVRGAWMSPKGSSAELLDVAANHKVAFNCRNAWIDRSQGSLRDQFEYQVGMGGYKGESSVEMRIGALLTLIETGRFCIDSSGIGGAITELWNQLTSYARDENQRVIEKSDDLVDALLYALAALTEPRKSGLGPRVEIVAKEDSAEVGMGYDEDAHAFHDVFNPEKWSDDGHGKHHKVKDYGSLI